MRQKNLEGSVVRSADRTESLTLLALLFDKQKKEKQAKVDGIYLHLWQTADKYVPLRSHSTHTTILRLPGKEVQQCSQRLADKTETNPKNGIAYHLPSRVLDLLQWGGDNDQR